MLGVCLWSSDQANLGIDCAHVALHFPPCHVTKCQCCEYIGTTLFLLLLEHPLLFWMDVVDAVFVRITYDAF